MVKDQDDKVPGQGERIQKVLAQAGVGSRREMEEWITAGRVTVNGEPATLGMRVVEGDVLRADKRTVYVKAQEDRDFPRVLLYHKQEGEIVSRDDPENRTSVFEKLPKLRGMKWIAIGRLDYNTSGLLIFTTSGELANRLMHPRFEVEREYAVRVQGVMTPEQMRQMTREGIELEDGPVKLEKLTDEGGEGFNHWYRLVLKEGRNRVVRRIFEALGLVVSRLMRVRFGIINLPPSIKRGKMAELGEGEVNMILDWVGLSAQTVDEDATEDPRAAEGKIKQMKSAPPHKGQRAEPAKTGRHVVAKGRQKQAGAAVSRGGRNKTKAGVKG
ncbi:MAG: pseudouridine synthase [Gallionellaceae bacterium]|jgi:23S rRNA pseudouridine2605 synthase